MADPSDPPLTPMPWLLRDGIALAPLEVADTPRRRVRGLLGRDGIDGALLLRPASSVHTLAMRFSIDVALCDRHLRVLRTVTMVPNRIGPPSLRVRAVVEAEAGSFEAWGLVPGQQLSVRR